MKKAFTISVIINISFILLSGYVIYKKGGIDYLKLRLILQPPEPDYGVSYDTRKSIFEIMPDDTNEIVFLGNSIIDYCEWSELLRNASVKNRGIGGDVIEGVKDRLDEVVSAHPKKIFLLIGINNLRRGNTVGEILTKYEELITSIKDKAPQTTLYVQSILPTYGKKKMNNSAIIEINKGLVKLSARFDLTYVNLFDLLKNEKNELDTRYSFDGLHLNGRGYLVWKKEIEQYVNN